ncbi:MAG: MmgE/PrpD family protein [Opitutales bacterium]|nr:MmgE/PrpD family protein [Opitutales bacterium]
MKGHADELAGFCLGITAENLPSAVEHEARRALVDVLGCVFLGAGEPSLNLRLPVAAEAGRPAASAFGRSGSRAAAPAAAAAHNACLAQVHDANDGHTAAAARKGLGHPGRAVVPTALAAVEADGGCLGDAVAAIAAGYEFGCRLLARHQPLNLEALGAVAALARQRRMPVEAFLAAAGLALPLSPQVLPLGWARSTHHNFLRCGAASRVAWEAEQAAGDGLRGPALSDAAADCLLSFETDGLGESFALSGRYSKPYPSCRMTHAAVECALAIRERPGFDVSRVREAEAAVVPGALYVAGTEVHEDFKRRAFSLPVCTGIALVCGRLTPDLLRSSLPPEVAAIAKRTTVTEDASFLDWYPSRGRPSRLRLTMEDGTVYEHRVDVPLGEPGNREPDERLLARFAAYGEGVCPRGALAAAAEQILYGPRATPVAEVMRHLTEGSA